MQLVERSALVKYSAAQMFALVNAVERYPEFLPWCAAAQVHDVSATERAATLRVARGVLKAEFTTRNLLTLGKRIQMQLTQGPFPEELRDMSAVGWGQSLHKLTALLETPLQYQSAPGA